MKNLHLRIEDRKRAINDKKYNLQRDLALIKRRLVSPSTTGIAVAAGALIGFLLLPKKYKFLKLLFKGFTLATTARQLLDHLPRHSSNEEIPVHPKKIIK